MVHEPKITTHKCPRCGAPLEGLIKPSPVSFVNPYLTVQYMFPNPRRMVAEYATMLSRLKDPKALKWVALLGAVLGVMWLIFLFGPSMWDPATHALLRVFASLNDYFVLGGSAVLVLFLARPLLTRLILPLGNLVIEIAKQLFCSVLFAAQYMVFDLLDGGPGALDSFWVKLRCGVLSTTSGPRHPSKCRAAAEPRVHFVFCCAFRHSRPLGRILAPKFSFVLLSSIRVVHVPRKAVV